MAEPQAIKTRTLINYGAVMLPMSVVGIPFGLYIPTMYAEAGVSLALIGTALLLARFSDVVTDPLVGVLSDRTNTRMGRRKPWLLSGVPVLLISIYMLFVPPENPTILYFIVWVMGMYLAFTVIDLPYFAWGAELSTDYNERSRVTGIREQLQIAGTLLATGLPALLLVAYPLFGLESGYLGLSQTAQLLGIVVVVLVPVLILNAVFTVPEPERKEIPRRPASMVQTLKIVSRNGPYVRIVICFTVSTIGSAMTNSLSLLFVKHVIQAEELYSVYLLFYFLAMFAGVPVWNKLAARIGKHKAMMAAIFWYAFWASFIPFIPAGWFPLFLVIMCLKGSAVGALSALPASMLADVIDIDTARTGKQRAGLYFSLWTMIRKGGYAVGQFVAFTLLAVFAFDATVDPMLTPDEGGNPFGSKIALAILYSIVPAMFKFMAIPFLWRYPLTQERQQRIRAHIERRAAALGRPAPAGARRAAAPGVAE